MSQPTQSPPASGARPPGGAGIGTTLRAAVDAGALGGLLFGLVDGVQAWWRTPPAALADTLGSLAGAVFLYALVGVAGALLAAPLVHPFVARRGLADRIRAFLVPVIGFGLFVELFWLTQPYVFSGLSASDPRRVAASAGLLVLGLALAWVAVRLGRRVPRTLGNLASTLVLVLAFAGAVYLGSSSPPGDRGKVNDRNADLPNVVLFVVDALRADLIGAYGDAETSTPVIDALAERGVLFENAFVQAPYTWTSFGSILTGKYPRRHGLVKMEAGVRMLPTNVTLPVHLKQARRGDGRQLQEQDYVAATFMTGTLSHGNGLGHGFDVYFEAMVGHELVDTDVPWSVFRSELLLFRTKNKLVQRIDNQLVATTASRWLSEHSHRRFVAMVHYYSTHTPYDPPERYREAYVDPGYDGPVSAFYASSREAIEAEEYEPTPADVRQITDLYQAGVTQADAMIGTVLDELERQGVLQNTLVIVTSDHGEELGDHDLWEHNWMYQTNLRIPLVMALPGRLPAGVRVEPIVDTIDLLPTVSDLLGLEAPGDPTEAEERGLVDGRSLLPVIRGQAAAVREFSFAENGLYMSIQDTDWKLIVGRSLVGVEGLDIVAAARGEVLLPPSETEIPPRLFHLALDPDERENVFASHPGQAARLFAELRAWDERMPIPSYELQSSHRDIEDAERLRTLGYTDGIGIDAEEADPRSDDEGALEVEGSR